MDNPARAAARIEGAVARVERRYAHGEDRPLGSYAVLAGTYVGWASAVTAFARWRRARLPERFSAADVALLAVGVFRASRLIAKDSITSFARAPLTRYEGPGAPDEVHEEVVGTGFAHALGELVTCPFCLSVWLATTATAGMVVFPRQTRAVCALLAAVAGADGLQYLYTALDQLTG